MARYTIRLTMPSGSSELMAMSRRMQPSHHGVCVAAGTAKRALGAQPAELVIWPLRQENMPHLHLENGTTAPGATKALVGYGEFGERSRGTTRTGAH